MADVYWGMGVGWGGGGVNLNFTPNTMSPKRVNVRNTAKVSFHNGAELGLSGCLAGLPVTCLQMLVGHQGPRNNSGAWGTFGC